MAHINVDLGNKGDDDLHPEGPMRLKLVSYEVRTKNDNSGQYIAWRADPHTDITNRRPVWFNTSLSNLVGLKALLKAIGMKPSEEGFDPDDAIGGEFIAKIGQEEYAGEPKNTVNFPYQKVK